MPTESTTGHFNKKESEDFFHRLRCHFVGFIVFPAVFCKNPNFLLKIGDVPPIMDPMVSGEVLYDTEFKVSSVLTLHLFETN